jgi:hypothetical protein
LNKTSLILNCSKVIEPTYSGLPHDTFPQSSPSGKKTATRSIIKGTWRLGRRLFPVEVLLQKLLHHWVAEVAAMEDQTELVRPRSFDEPRFGKR